MKMSVREVRANFAHAIDAAGRGEARRARHHRVELSHGGPFDEMLLIHAQRLGAKLLTRDRLLLGHLLVVQP